MSSNKVFVSLSPFDTVYTTPTKQPRPCIYILSAPVHIGSSYHFHSKTNYSSYQSISGNMSSPQIDPEAPAFTCLLDAYDRWQDFEQSSAQNILSLRNVPISEEHAQTSVPTPASLAFMMTCPYIDVPALPEDERICHVCKDPYHYLNDRVQDENLKVAQRLPCRHYLCNHCLYQWLDPFDQSNNNTCPYDRRVLFPKLPHFLSTEGMQQRADLVDWYNEARERHPAGGERDQTRGLKVMLVERRLGEAIEELELDCTTADTVMMQQQQQRRIRAHEIDATVLHAYNRELQHFEHRLSTIGAIAVVMAGYMQVSTLQARLQNMSVRLARDRANVQGLWSVQ